MVAVWFYYQDDGRSHVLHDIAHYLVQLQNYIFHGKRVGKYFWYITDLHLQVDTKKILLMLISE